MESIEEIILKPFKLQNKHYGEVCHVCDDCDFYGVVIDYDKDINFNDAIYESPNGIKKMYILCDKSMSDIVCVNDPVNVYALGLFNINGECVKVCKKFKI